MSTKLPPASSDRAPRGGAEDASRPVLSLVAAGMIAFPMLVGLALGCGEESSRAQVCVVAADCPMGQVCSRGYCVFPGPSNAAPDPDGDPLLDGGGADHQDAAGLDGGPVEAPDGAALDANPDGTSADADTGSACPDRVCPDAGGGATTDAGNPSGPIHPVCWEAQSICGDVVDRDGEVVNCGVCEPVEFCRLGHCCREATTPDGMITYHECRGLNGGWPGGP